MAEYRNWTSCCRKRNCPEVKVDEKFLYIKDDYGNVVKIERSKTATFQELLEGVFSLINPK